MEYVVLVLIIIAAVYAVALYNGLVKRRNRFRNAFAQIDVQLARRHDLIPNLVETAKGYLTHERQTLEAVVEARNQAVQKLKAAQPTDRGTMDALASAETQLTGALGKLFALVEAYPDLKANQNMMQVSEELTSTENRVAFARQAYNDAVMEYNNARETFPGNMIAGAFSFAEANLLEIEDEARREAPKVRFE